MLTGTLIAAVCSFVDVSTPCMHFASCSNMVMWLLCRALSGSPTADAAAVSMVHAVCDRGQLGCEVQLAGAAAEQARVQAIESKRVGLEQRA